MEYNLVKFYSQTPTVCFSLLTLCDISFSISCIYCNVFPMIFENWNPICVHSVTFSLSSAPYLWPTINGSIISILVCPMYCILTYLFFAAIPYLYLIHPFCLLPSRSCLCILLCFSRALRDMFYYYVLCAIQERLIIIIIILNIITLIDLVSLYNIIMYSYLLSCILTLFFLNFPPLLSHTLSLYFIFMFDYDICMDL